MAQSFASNTCPECAAFLEAVEGIRGAYFLGREHSGRRQSYAPGQRPFRDGSVSVSEGFHADVVHLCGAWFEHIEEQDNARNSHLEALPRWLRDAAAEVGFSKAMGRDVGVRVAAQVLGVAPRSVYRLGRFRD